MTGRVPDGSSLVRLALAVRDLDRCVGFYRDVLGLEAVEERGDRACLAPPARRFVLDLMARPGAPLRPYPCVGLYHFALLVPDRAALGAVFRRLIERGEPLEGMADHAVSEALYLRDPELNGIELYRDRPRHDWVYEDGQLKMVSDPLDTEGILGAAAGPAPLHAETRLGHIHLHVPALDGAEAFFATELGLGVTQRSLPGALFFAAGDYHHHVGANVWAPDRVVPPGATGLRSYTWRLPAGEEAPTGSLRDPVGAEVRFEAA